MIKTLGVINDLHPMIFIYDEFTYQFYFDQPILEAKGTAVWLDRNYRPIRIPAEFKTKLLQFSAADDPN